MAAQKRRKRTSAKQSAQKIRITKRTLRVMELRERGWEFRPIAAELGVSLGTVYKDYEAAMTEAAEAIAERAERQRQDSLRRMNRVVLKNDPLLDDDRRCARASEVIIKAEERRAKLLGLDAPTKQQISGEVALPGMTLEEMLDARRVAEANEAGVDELADARPVVVSSAV